MRQLILFLFLFSSFIIAQGQTISGRVTSYETGEALVGVNILLKNTTIGTATDQTGNFTIEAKGLPISLVFSSIGYQKQTVEITDDKFLNVSLRIDVYSSEDVVVVGSEIPHLRRVDHRIELAGTPVDLRLVEQIALAHQILHQPVGIILGCRRGRITHIEAEIPLVLADIGRALRNFPVLDAFRAVRQEGEPTQPFGFFCRDDHPGTIDQTIGIRVITLQRGTRAG